MKNKVPPQPLWKFEYICGRYCSTDIKLRDRGYSEFFLSTAVVSSSSVPCFKIFKCWTLQSQNTYKNCILKCYLRRVSWFGAEPAAANRSKKPSSSPPSSPFWSLLLSAWFHKLICTSLKKKWHLHFTRWQSVTVVTFFSTWTHFLLSSGLYLSLSLLVSFIHLCM